MLSTEPNTFDATFTIKYQPDADVELASRDSGNRHVVTRSFLNDTSRPLYHAATQENVKQLDLDVSESILHRVVDGLARKFGNVGQEAIEMQKRHFQKEPVSADELVETAKFATTYEFQNALRDFVKDWEGGQYRTAPSVNLPKLAYVAWVFKLGDLFAATTKRMIVEGDWCEVNEPGEEPYWTFFPESHDGNRLEEVDVSIVPGKIQWQIRTHNHTMREYNMPSGDVKGLTLDEIPIY